jgi:hypothetical protein
MHDQAAVPRPDRLGDERLEDRADDEVGPGARHRRLYRRGGVDDGDPDVVAEVDERDACALARLLCAVTRCGRALSTAGCALPAVPSPPRERPDVRRTAPDLVSCRHLLAHGSTLDAVRDRARFD